MYSLYNRNFLDFLNVMSIVLQIQSIENNEKYTNYVHNEIDRLHMENGLIIEELKRLKGEQIIWN